MSNIVELDRLYARFQIKGGKYGKQLEVSPDGETLFVSEYDKDVVHILRKSPDGDWREEGQLANPNYKYSGFGSAIKISPDGETLYIGAPVYNDNGAVLIFARTESGEWINDGIIPSSSKRTNGYGTAIEISPSGDTLFVGDDGLSVVHIFKRSPSGGLDIVDTLTDPVNKYSRFGSAIKISPDGKTLYVGDPMCSGNGAVLIFARTESGEWTNDGIIPSSSDSVRYGEAIEVSPDGKNLYIGDPGINAKGIVRILTKSPDGDWVPLISFDGNNNNADRFGSALLLLKDGSLLVGSPREHGSVEKCGAVHILRIL